MSNLIHMARHIEIVRKGLTSADVIIDGATLKCVVGYAVNHNAGGEPIFTVYRDDLSDINPRTGEYARVAVQFKFDTLEIHP